MQERSRRTLSRRTLVAGATVAAAGARRPVDASAQPAPAIAWERVAADAAGPPARWDHTLVADPDRNRLILFGGRDSAGTALNDTWAFDIEPGTWTQIASEEPGARFGAAVAIDAAGAGMYLFGGQAGERFLNDTWRYDLALDTWQPLDGGDAVAPSPRYGLGGVIDNANRFVISHGFTFDGRFDDTWAFDLAAGSWAEISPPLDSRPLARCLHEQVWDAGAGLMLMYAGCSSGVGPCPQGDTWTLDPALGTWREVTPAIGPDPRMNAALTRTPSGAAILLFGGQTATGNASDGWLGTLADGAFSWAVIQPNGEAPAPRSSHDLTTLGDRVYLFGGRSDAGVLGDLWSATLA